MTKQRVGEIDFLRGLALVLMVIFHFLYDLQFILHFPINVEEGIYALIGKVSGNLFILVSGISASFSRNNLKRGLKVFGLGMLISGLTYSFYPDFFIQFGILHLLGLSMIMIHFMKKMKALILLIASLPILLLGLNFFPIVVDSRWLFPLGFIHSQFTSADYYPLIPYFGVFLMGVSFGKVFYQNKIGRIPFLQNEPFISQIGRHTLLIYLLHQPIMIFFLSLLTR